MTVATVKIQTVNGVFNSRWHLVARIGSASVCIERLASRVSWPDCMRQTLAGSAGLSGGTCGYRYAVKPDLSKFGRLNGSNPFCSDWVIRNAESKLALHGIGSVRYQTLKIAWKVERQNPLAIHRIASGSICQKISLDRISTTVRRALARPPRNCQ